MPHASTDHDLSETHGSAYDDEPRLLWDLLQDGVTKNSQGLALACLHQESNSLSTNSAQSAGSPSHLEWTYTAMSNAAISFANSIQLVRRQGTNSTFATFVPNGVEWSLAYWTAARLQMPIAAMDPKILEMKDISTQTHYLTTVDPGMVLVQDTASAVAFDAICDVAGIRPWLKLVCVAIADSEQIKDWQDLQSFFGTLNQKDADEVGQQPIKGSPDGIARILFTGGSTGLPKGCPHSSANLCAESAGYSKMRGLTSKSRTLIQSPVHHIMANAGALLTWRAGGAVVFPAARFDPGESIRAIQDYSCTYLPVHHSMTDALIRHPDFSSKAMESVRQMQIGGALIGMDLVERYSKLFQNVEIFPFWGSTEGMYTTACSLGDPLVARKGLLGVGKSIRGGRVKVVDPDTLATVPRGQIGELNYGGATVISEYCKKASPESFYKDECGVGWFRTGDQGLMASDGSIFMLGRYKDMIKRGGENIFPQQIEHTLLTSSSKTKVIIIGIPDEVMGEACVAVVDPDQSENFSKFKLQADVALLFGSEFVFSHVLTLKDLGLSAYPLNPGGKVLKPKLRDVVLKHIESKKNATNGESSTIALVKSIWVKLLYVDASELDPATSMSSFMDSLTGMRYCFEVEKATSKQLILADLQNAPTIKEQANLIDSAVKGAIGESLTEQSIRSGPPGANDIAWCGGDVAKLATLRKAVEAVLAERGLTWDADVEDVYTAPGLWGLIATVPPALSGNLRWSYEVKGFTSDQIRAAIIKAMEPRPILRTLNAVFDGTAVMFQVRISETYLSHAVRYGPEFSTMAEAVNTSLHEPSFLMTKPPEGLFLANISHVSETSSHLVTLSLSHSICDAFTNGPFWADIETFLHNPDAPQTNSYASFKLYSDMYYLHSDSTLAQQSAKYQASRLRGCGHGAHADAAWPKYFGGDFDPVRIQKYTGQRSVKHTKDAPGLTALQLERGIAPALVLKLAFSLAMMRRTHAPSAQFLSFEAGRVWPFAEEWIQKRLPNPLAINGPTSEPGYQWVIPGKGESVVEICDRLRIENDEMAPHAHTPWPTMVEMLETEEDRIAVDRNFKMIMFNVVPDIRRFAGHAQEQRKPLLEQRGVTFYSLHASYFQAGFVGETCVVKGLYDELQISKEDFSLFVEDCLNILVEMARKESWDKEALSFI